MKKKAVLLLSTFTTFGVVAATLLLTNYGDTIPTSGTGEQSVISLSSSAAVQVSPDDPLVHQVNVRNNKFDVVGYDSTGGAFGSIAGTMLGSEEYHGMIYNRSAINGFKTLSVKFSGGSLSYVLTDFLMQDMTFSGEQLTSEETINVPEGKAYFLIYTTFDEPVAIDFVNITYACDGSIDDQMIFNKNTALGNARSMAKSYYQEDSYIEIENNPTKTTNNYSTGSHSGHDDTWYRWNGKYFSSSAQLGTEFEFGMTVMGSYDRMVDVDKYFHYTVWPQFSYGNASDRPWVQTYVGNDNYEPLGKDDALHPSDPYVQYSYKGRFYTDYIYENGDWIFADPDTHCLPGSGLTYRQAYEAFNMPFWFMKFHVYLDETNNAICDTYINNFFYQSVELFEKYDRVNTPSINIHTMPMHVVNYGVDAEGNPADSYKGWFTYPRLMSNIDPVQSSAYFLEGDFNNWAQVKEYNFVQDSEDQNIYRLRNVQLTAGEKMKVNDPALGNNGWYGPSHAYEGCHYWVDDWGNCVVDETGTYDVTFYYNATDGNHIQIQKPAIAQNYTITDLPNWLKNDNAAIFAWVWGDHEEGAWIEIELEAGQTSATFEASCELNGMILVRCAEGTVTPDWDHLYNRAATLTCTSGVYSYSSPSWN